MSFSVSRVPAIRVLSTSSNLCFNSCYSTHHLQSNASYKAKMEKVNHQRKNTLLGPDKKFPFPGDVICAVAYENRHKGAKMIEQPAKNHSDSFKISSKMPTLPSQASTSKTAIYISRTLNELLDSMQSVVKKSDDYFPLESFINDDLIQPNSTRKVQLVVTECPKLLKLELRNYFHVVDMSSRKVTLLNLVLQEAEENDFSSDDNDTNASKTALRQTILFEFIEAATNICKGIQSLGFWADFIDPRNGRPFFSCQTTASMLECDKRYTDLGFRVEDDVSGIKVLENVQWTDRKFVGTIFTDANERDIEKKILKCIEE